MKNLTIKELTAKVVELGDNGGGDFDITGTWKGKPKTIHVEQTEWYETPVCLVGGYGNEVSAIDPDNVASVFDCVIGNYLDGETFSIEEAEY